MSRVTIEFEWQPVGEITPDGPRPRFPALPAVPGLYRFEFSSLGGLPRVYVGETDNLARRTQLYRTPGKSQATNLRMNKELMDALGQGAPVACSTITAASISVDGAQAQRLDLTRKTGRLIVENAAMAGIVAAREFDPDRGAVLMNRPGVGEDDWR